MNIVVFRVDANEKVGIGHLMRCLTLAYEFKKNTQEIHFICKNSKLDISLLVKEGEFFLHQIDADINSQKQDVQQTSNIIEKLTEQPTWLIIDHYGLDASFESLIRPKVKKIMIIDDYANRKHDCDLLLDQNIFPNNRYDRLLPANCKQLIGTKYTLLRSEFTVKRAQVNRNFNAVNHILINFGGGDDRGLIEKSVLAILKHTSSKLRCDVILGQANPNKAHLMNFLALYGNIRVFTHVNNIAELMLEADLAIGSGGSTIWERCCLGLPSIVIAMSDIEEQLASVCAEKNLIYYLGRYEKISIDCINNQLMYLLKNTEKLKQMSANGLNIVDGFGANTVMKAMLALSHV